MNWISLTELAVIHERVIAETGGIRGMTNPGGLESALARPFHPFVDGNKRTALVAADVCLRLNGHRLLFLIVLYSVPFCRLCQALNARWKRE